MPLFLNVLTQLLFRFWRSGRDELPEKSEIKLKTSTADVFPDFLTCYIKFNLPPSQSLLKTKLKPIFDLNLKKGYQNNKNIQHVTS